MKIILINHYAGNPKLGMELRPYYLAKEWVKNGHKVLIVGASFSHLRNNQPHQGFETVDGIDFLWLKTNKYKGNGVKRLLSMLYFVFNILCKMRTFVKFAPDAVIASSTYPLDIFPANRIAHRSKAKLVFEIHDLWPLSPMELAGMSKYHPFIMLMQWAENYAFKKCDVCISILPHVHAHVQKHGLNMNKLQLVPNGVVLDDWENPEPLSFNLESFCQDLKNKGKFIIGYAGGHAISNNLDILIDAMALLKDDNIVLILIGNGTEKERLRQRVCDENLNQVYFWDPISKYQIPLFLKNMDALYIGGKDSPLYKYGISCNKIFDYMMAKKPIIQAINAANNFVEDANCGIYAEPNNPQSIAESVLSLASLSEKQRNALGENGFYYAIKNHNYAHLAKFFINYIN